MANHEFRPGSHSTGGAKDHTVPGEGERHSSAPSVSRKDEPMTTQERPASQQRVDSRTRGNPDGGLPPDEDA